MTECTQSEFPFPACKQRKIETDFQGGDITSDAGLLLLRQADRQLGLSRCMARALKDDRRKKSCEHSLEQLLRQRIYGLAAGYEDLNDHNELRHDPLLQTAVDKIDPLGSASTLCRWENRMDREAAVTIHEQLVETFIGSFRKPPEELVLDFDATDDRVHGRQEGRFFHGYYDHYCFLPLYVFCGDQLLVSYLRPANMDGARHAWAILALLVKRLRREWPDVRIIFRGDSGFCRWRMLRWMEHNNIKYIVGLAKNERLNDAAMHIHERARDAYEVTAEKTQVFDEIRYGARTWDKARRILVRAEHGPMGGNPRYVVTNLRGAPKRLYKELFCGRGDMENRIKEQQLALFADRTSAHKWWANQFRLLLSSLAYVLLEHIRRVGLKGTDKAHAQCHTLRLLLIKIGAVITRNTRRIRVCMSSNHPHQELFWLVARRMSTA